MSKNTKTSTLNILCIAKTAKLYRKRQQKTFNPLYNVNLDKNIYEGKDKKKILVLLSQKPFIFLNNIRSYLQKKIC